MVRRNVQVRQAVAATLAWAINSWISLNAQEMTSAPPFEWDAAFASPNASLTLNEANRPPRTSSQQAIFYRVDAAGFSSDEPLSFWVRRGPERFFAFPATVDNEGVVRITVGQDILGALLVLAFRRDEGIAVFVPGGGGSKALMLAGFAEGHPLDVALVSENGGKRAHAKVVPIPLRAEGNGGCSATAELQSETGLLLLVNLEGFLPDEVVQIQSQYKRDVASSAKPASQSGDLALPVLFGKGDRGTASVTATAESCTVTLQYNVGRDALVR